MFKNRIVLVVGAGASVEYRLPLGGALKQRIAEQLSFALDFGRLSKGDQNLFRLICNQKAELERNEYFQAGNELAAMIPSAISIDEALHYVSGTAKAVELGKCAIIKNILEAEAGSSLVSQSALQPLPDDTWIAHFFSMAFGGLTKSQAAQAFDAVTIINFNYDRCIEHFLFNALVQRAGMSAGEAQKIINGLNMIRPYGSVGKMPWHRGGVQFGDSRQTNLFASVDQIRTYTEGIRDEAGDIAQALNSAAMIIFVGFGFHQSNLDLLKVEGRLPNLRSILGTSKGINAGNNAEIVRRIAINLHADSEIVSLFDLTATELFRELRQRILLALD